MPTLSLDDLIKMKENTGRAQDEADIGYLKRIKNEKDKSGGFEYYLTKESIDEYRKKPLELRLQWLYMGNLFRKDYPGDIVKRQDNFRGK